MLTLALLRSIGSVRYSLRSVRGLRVIEYLPGRTYADTCPILMLCSCGGHGLDRLVTHLVIHSVIL
eukprot:848674-Alexandrium_andersonii.AAC.1